MRRLPEYMTQLNYRSFYEDAVYNVVLDKIDRILAENKLAADRSKRRYKRVDSSTELITSKAQLSLEIGIARKNLFTKAGQIYKVGLIGSVLGARVEVLIDMDEILLDATRLVRDDLQVDVSDEEIFQAVLDFYGTPTKSEKIEAIYSKFREKEN